MGLFSRPETAVLLVCAANICRSPMAEGLLRAELKQRGLQKKVRVESAGTHATQPGRAADQRAQRLCAQHGIDIGRSRARQVVPADFERFDHVLAMDERNMEWLMERSPEAQRYKLALVSAWSDGSGQIVIPDPYFGNAAGFTNVYSLLEAAIAAFVAHNLES